MKDWLFIILMKEGTEITIVSRPNSILCFDSWDKAQGELKRQMREREWWKKKPVEMLVASIPIVLNLEELWEAAELSGTSVPMEQKLSSTTSRKRSCPDCGCDLSPEHELDKCYECADNYCDNCGKELISEEEK